jgi:hypothetical protein
MSMDVASQITRLSLVGNYPDLSGPELLPMRLTKACAEVLPVSAVSVSVFGEGSHRVPLGSSSAASSVAERLQFTIGEGPCLAAHGSNGWVIATEEVLRTSWPDYHRELLAHTPLRAVVSSPVGHGLGGIAAVDFYFDRPEPPITAALLEDLESAADVVGALLMAHSGLVALTATPPKWLETQAAAARSEVWVALGMLNLAMEIDNVTALDRLHDYADGQQRTVEQVALALTTGQLTVDAIGL